VNNNLAGFKKMMSTLRQYLSGAAKRKRKIEKENENKKIAGFSAQDPPRILFAAPLVR
jgi:hypothetical protein